MKVLVKETLTYDEIQQETKKITEEIFNYVKSVNEYLGMGTVIPNGIEQSQLYHDINKILLNRFTEQVDEDIFEVTERVKNLLIDTVYQKIWNSNILTFDKTIVGEAISSLENNTLIDAEYITQTEASKILGKDVAFITNMIQRFDPKTINGRRLVKRSLVLDYKKYYDVRKDYETDEDYLNANEVAEKLNLSIHMAYKLMKEGELSEKTEGTGISIYIRKEYVEEYRKKREAIKEKYNMFDFIGVQDSAKLFGKTPATIGNWIKKGIIKNTKKVGRNYEIPRNEVLRVMREEGIENADSKLKQRDKTLFQYIKVYTRALKMEDNETQEEILQLAEENGMRDYMKVTRESFHKGEDVYIPDWITEEFEIN